MPGGSARQDPHDTCVQSPARPLKGQGLPPIDAARRDQVKRHVDAAVADLGRVYHDRQIGLVAHGPESLEHRRARVGDDGFSATDELGYLGCDASTP